MNSRILPYAALLLCGAVVGAIARGALSTSDAPAAGADPRPAATTGTPRLDPSTAGASDQVIGMLESLSAALIRESEYRLVLEEQIDALSERVDALQAQVDDAPAARSGRDVRRLSETDRRARATAPLTVERLMAAGMDETRARSLKSRLDDIAMQRLYLRDQATREGWMGDPRYRDEARRLMEAQNNIRSEFGDDAYDRYLYASGQPNRVQIQSVLENSPAWEAGLRAGDQILSYNDQRTYAPGELRRATQRGAAGETIAMQVMRNGELVNLYVPRGPLGVQMSGASERP
jgi:hypothetical protein